MSKSINTFKHGAFAQVIVFPWEDQRKFDALHEALRVEYKPIGVSEEATILEIADVHWRKQRLRFGATHSACKDAPTPELVQAARDGPQQLADHTRKKQPIAGGLRLTFSQALDLVRDPAARAACVQSAPAESVPQTPVERAYDPDFMMKYSRAEAALENRLSKLLQRYAQTKAYKKLQEPDYRLITDAGARTANSAPM